MGQLEDDVRELILSRYDNVAAFARKIGLPTRTLYSALSKGLQKTTLGTIIPICTELGIDPVEISKGHLAFTAETPKPAFVPLYGSICAGGPREMETADDIFPIPASLHDMYPQAYMLRISGNSMNKILPDGSLALVQPCTSIDASGQIYVVQVGDTDATVKRVISHDNGYTLQPESTDPTYKPKLYDYSEPDTPTLSVIGRVVWFCHGDMPTAEAV